MLVSNPKWVPAAPLFPLGLIAVFPNGTEMAVMAWMMLLPVCVGWAFYALLTIVMVETRRNWLFVLIYVIFCLALALNVVGCNKTVEAVQGIH
jgi:hypothetical protein